MTLHYVISVHAKFLLLDFFCLWVCRPEECFWLNRKACYTVIKVKSWSLVTVVLAACCCFLVLFDSSWMFRSLCPFCSLTVFSLGGFPKLFPSGIGAFCSFHILQTKMHLTLLPVFSFGNRCVSSHPSSHTITSWECLSSILTFSWIIFPSESRASYVHSYTD